MPGADIEDDTSIPASARLLRRVPPNHIAPTFRPDSSNFQERSAETGLSVTLWETNADLEVTVAEKPEFGVVFVTAESLRDAGYVIVRAPLPGNPNHCECYGSPSQGRRRKLAVDACWVKVPNGLDPGSFGNLATLND